MKKIIDIIRWIILIPFVVFIYIIGLNIIDTLSSYTYPALIHDLNSSYDFAGHYIMGPIFVFLKEGITIELSLLLGMRIAPNRNALFVLTGFWVLFILLFLGMFIANGGYNFGWEENIRSLLSVLGQVVGVIAGYSYSHNHHYKTKSAHEHQ